MTKRSFLRVVSSALSLPSLTKRQFAKSALTNWAGNISYSTENVHEAANVEDIRSALRSSEKIRVLGTRHCFNTIADSRSNLLSLKLGEDIALDPPARTVTVNANLKYGQLAPYLDRKEWALHNLASLPHISIAGAVSTATHGSGERNGNLSSAVSALEMVTASGDVVHLSRKSNPAEFAGAVVGLGALGVITRVTLDLQPTYKVRQYVYQDLPLRQLQDHFDEIQTTGYSVSLFTDWRNKNVSELWVKSRVDGDRPFSAPDELFGAKRARAETYIQSPNYPPKTARNRWACPGPGMNGCRTFAWASRRARAKNCRPNICFRAGMPSKPFSPSNVSGTK